MRSQPLLLLLFIPTLFGFSGFQPPTYTFSPALGDIQVINLEGNSGREVVYIEDAVTEVQICQLQAGETYVIQAVAMQDCQPLLDMPGSGKAPQSMFNFVADASCKTILVHADYLKKACTGAMYLSINCNSCFNEPVSSYSNRAPIFATPGIPAQTLVENVLIGGGCFDVMGISHAGAAIARGSFLGGNTSIGLNTGVILSSGNVAIATGPNNATGAGAASGGGSDPDLAQAANGAAIFDASILEFDFTPTQAQVTFRYVFASEEYCDYVNSSFNDVFGFFLSGPGISGPYSNNSVNIAVLPSSVTPVTINNVNHIDNSLYYTGNIPAGSPQLTNPNCAGHPISGPPSTDDCQYDGYTKILTAVANVIPCETYHIKLAIADAGDTAFDSAVFLEANSFDAGGDAEVVANVPFTQTTTAYEGCTPAFFMFSRSGGATNVPLVINYTISGTATSGVDYTSLPLSVTIPANQMFFQLPVNIIDDIIPEGTETITITLQNPCSCTTSSVTLNIVDPPPIDLNITGDIVCQGNPVFITPMVSGGVQPYQYSWNPANSGPVFVGFPTQSGTYTLTVTDHCGTTDVDTANVQVYTLSGSISGTALVCPGSPGTLNVNFTGVGPFTLIYLVNGANPTTINGITQNPYSLQVTQPGTYTIVAVTNGECVGTGSGIGLVTQPVIGLGTTVTNVGCFGELTGAIDLGAAGGTGPYTYDWSNNADTEDLEDLPAGSYTVTVEDINGCFNTINAQVTQPPNLTASALVLSGVDCTNPTGGAINLSVGGGTLVYSYLWNTGDTIQDISGLTAGTYTVTVTDSNGCTESATAVIQGDTNIPTAIIDVAGEVNCTNTALTLDGTGSSGGPGFVYQWVASGGGNITGLTDQLTTTADGGGTYELIVTDTLNNCFTAASVVVPEDFNIPVADPGADQIIDCLNSEVTLDGSNSSSGPDINYTWTASPGGSFSSPTNIESPTADAPGVYTLVVFDTDNGCADTSTVVVTADLTDPTAAAGLDGVIDCFSPTIQLNGSGSSSGANFTYLWSTIDGNIVDDPTLTNPTIDQEGTYTLLVTNTVNGCTSSDPVSVSDLSIDPVIQIDAPGLLTCAITELSLDATGSDTGSQYTFTWTGLNGGIVVSGGNTPTPVIGAVGTYELVLSNSLTGCQSIDSVDVADNLTPPLAEAGNPVTIACSLPNMQLDGSGSSVGPGFTFIWTATNGGNIVGGANTANPTVNSPGTYFLTVTDFANGCIAIDSVEVVLDTNAPVAAANAAQILDCAHPSVLVSGIGSSLGSNFNYVWNTLDGNIVNGNGTLFLTVNEPGTYTLTVTNDLNGCSSQISTTLNIDTLAPVAQVANPDLLTCAVNSIQLDGANSSAGPEFSYLWSTTDGNIVGDNTIANPAADQPGTYSLLVTDSSNGCTTETSVTVLQNTTPPAAEAGLTSTLNCGVTSLSLNGTGSAAGSGISYSWTTNNGNIVSGDNSLNPLIDAPGIYQITVLNGANGCSASDQVTVNLDVTPPQALIVAPGILTCATTSLTLNGSISTGTSALTYAWSTLNGVIAGPTSIATPMITQPGNYQLIVTQTGNQCKDTAVVNVTQNIVPPIAEAGPSFELDCGTTALALNGTGSSAGASFGYTWSTGSGIIVSGGNTLNPMIGAAGFYTLTVLDNVNGCSSTDQVEVTLDANAPVANAGVSQELTCTLTSLSLNGGGSSQGVDFTYQWTGPGIVSGVNTMNPVVNTPGTYILIVTNLLNDCMSSSPVTVTQNITPPTAEAGASIAITCANPVVSLNGGSSSQGPNFNYLWTTLNGNILSGANSLSPQVSLLGTYNLLVTNTANGCTSTDATTVTLNQTPPTIVLQTPNPLTCALTSLVLGASGTSTGPNFTYLWTTLDGQIISGVSSLAPTIGNPGTYTLTATNTQNGCVASQSVTVAENVTPPAAVAGSTNELTCAVTTLQLNGAGSSTGVGFSYQWVASGGGVISSGAATLTPTISQPGTYTITVLNAANGCTSSDVVVITEDVEAPTVQIGSPQSLTCLVDEISLNAGGSDSGTGFQLTWSASGGGNIVSTANILQPLVDAAGSYTLTILDTNNGCTSTLTVVVNETIDPPGAEAGPDFLLHCNQPTVALQGSSSIGTNGQYLWTTLNGAILGGANTAQPVVGAAGAYLLTVTNPLNGCVSTDEVFVTESFPVAFDYVVDPPVCVGFPGSIQFGEVLGGTPPYQYSISGGFTFSGQNFYAGLEAGTYDLVVRDANGCDLLDEAFLSEGVEVDLEVEREVFLDLGNSYQVQVFVNIDENDIESITWEPDLFLSCNDCLTPMVTPTHAVDYLVTVITEEGCEGAARISFRVNKQANVYVPNIFTPNGDGENDVFMIFAGNQVKEVKNFLVFNRWGNRCTSSTISSPMILPMAGMVSIADRR
ncbi:MAG: choice-of-anchor L domain-containing protein [Saprospirales bacterium]|nr:choice-of-anchor L domain-containing protein [Saprospirales bacterium]